jgi:putative heme-binding domain-containing protein
MLAGALGSAQLAEIDHFEFSDLGRLRLGQSIAWRLSEVNDPHLLAALLAAASRQPGQVLFGLIDHQQTPAGTIELLAQHYARSGGDAFLPMILQGCGRKDVAIINGLAAGWPSGKTVKYTSDKDKATTEKAILALLPELPPVPRGKLIKLASTWGVKGIDEQLAAITKTAFATLADLKAKDADRISAAQQIVEFQPNSDDAAAKLLAAITADTSPALSAGIFEALSQSKAKGVGVAVVARLKDLPVGVRPAALRLVLAKADSAKAFLDAVEKGTLRFDMLALDQRTALASHPDKDISTRARKILELGGGLPNADRQKVIEELKDALAKPGNAENGKKMFLAHCAKCHKHGSEGTAIGPDLTGFAVHPREELMIAILDPSRSVEGNFKLYRVTTADDRTIIGILGAQTGTSVEVIDAEAKRHPLAKTDIVTMKETDKSLMPEGFEKVMKPAELADLLEFLTQKGKFVPLPLDKVATVITTKDMFFDAGGLTERMIFPDWKPKVFDGVPFVLVDPQKDRVKNAVMLNGPQGVIPPKMPKSVSLTFGGKAKAIHLLSGVSGWGALDTNGRKTVSMIVRITYDDGKTEDHELKNGVHFADYIRRVDVPESKFAFALRGQQLRYLAVTPKRPDAVVKTIELVKGPDRTAPIVMAVTVESP